MAAACAPGSREELQHVVVPRPALSQAPMLGAQAKTYF